MKIDPEKKNQLNVLFFFVCLIAALFYFDNFSKPAQICHANGGSYDIIPGGYGRCYKITVQQINYHEVKK